MNLLPELHIKIAEFIAHITDLRLLSRTCQTFYAIGTELIPQLERAYREKYKKLDFSRFIHTNSSLEKYTIELVLDGYEEVIPYIYYTYKNKVIFNMLAFCGNLELLKVAKNSDCPMPDYALFCASYNGHLDILKWIYSATTVRKINFVVKGACQQGHPEILDWMTTTRYCTLSGGILKKGVKYGHISIVEWAYKQYKICDGVSADIFNTASKYGQTHLLQWALDHAFNPSNAFYQWAIKRGHVGVLQWALDHYYLSETPLWKRAVKKEQTLILQWALDHRYQIGDEIYIKAVRHDKIKILQWAHDRQQKIYSSFLKNAVDFGSIKVLQWAKDNNYEFDADLALYAINNNLRNPSEWFLKAGLVINPVSINLTTNTHKMVKLLLHYNLLVLDPITSMKILSFRLVPIEFLEDHIVPKKQYHFTITDKKIKRIRYGNDMNCTEQKIIWIESNGNVSTCDFKNECKCWWYFYLPLSRAYGSEDNNYNIGQKINECEIHRKYNIL
jgi:hypothetical protein